MLQQYIRDILLSCIIDGPFTVIFIVDFMLCLLFLYVILLLQLFADSSGDFFYLK